MKKKPSVGVWLTMLWLSLCCLLSAVLLAASSLRMLAAGLILFVLCGAIIFLLRNSIRRGIRKLLAGGLEGESANLAALQAMTLPARDAGAVFRPEAAAKLVEVEAVAVRAG